MDRTTARIILLIVGVLVITGVYLWQRYQKQILCWYSDRLRKQRSYAGKTDDFDDYTGGEGDKPFDDYLDDYALSPARVRDSYWTNPLRPSIPQDDSEQASTKLRTNKDLAARPNPNQTSAEEHEPTPNVVLLSVVAVDNAYFTGGELMDAFEPVGLRYGNMGIFHFYNADDEILFSVASLVEPGTFPVSNMLSFECPGVVLFFQSGQVGDPLNIFDALVTCCHELAIRLNGVEWDADRQPLTTEKIVALRQSL